MDDLSFENLDVDGVNKLNASSPHINDLKDPYDRFSRIATRAVRAVNSLSETLRNLSTDDTIVNYEKHMLTCAKNRKKRKRKKRR